MPAAESRTNDECSGPNGARGKRLDCNRAWSRRDCESTIWQRREHYMKQLFGDALDQRLSAAAAMAGFCWMPVPFCVQYKSLHFFEYCL
jgi:hypothetical protein